MGRVFSDVALAERRKAQDRALAAQQHFFDGFNKEHTDKRGGWRVMKYERPQFTVVTASAAYRDGWEKVFGAPRRSTLLDSNPPTLGGKEVPFDALDQCVSER